MPSSFHSFYICLLPLSSGKGDVVGTCGCDCFDLQSNVGGWCNVNGGYILNPLSTHEAYLGLSMHKFVYLSDMFLFFSLLKMPHLVVQENVVFYIIWHFGLGCRTIKAFQENGLFQCKMSSFIHNKYTEVWKNIFIEEICSQHHTTWSVQLFIWSYDDVFTISHSTKTRTYCLLMMFVDVGNWYLMHFIH
jgi:hypothetical protein